VLRAGRTGEGFKAEEKSLASPPTRRSRATVPLEVERSRESSLAVMYDSLLFDSLVRLAFLIALLSSFSRNCFGEENATAHRDNNPLRYSKKRNTATMRVASRRYRDIPVLPRFEEVPPLRHWYAAARGEIERGEVGT
jgi:hypothetical protein